MFLTLPGRMNFYPLSPRTVICQLERTLLETKAVSFVSSMRHESTSGFHRVVSKTNSTSRCPQEGNYKSQQAPRTLAQDGRRRPRVLCVQWPFGYRNSCSRLRAPCPEGYGCGDCGRSAPGRTGWDAVAGRAAVLGGQGPADAGRRGPEPHARKDSADHRGKQRPGPSHGRRAAAPWGAGHHGLSGPRESGGGGGSAPPGARPGWGSRARRHQRRAGRQGAGPCLSTFSASLLPRTAAGVGLLKPSHPRGRGP